MARNPINPDTLLFQISVLKRNLEKGWSIPVSMRKARINQGQHSELLKIPEYKALIESYKRQFHKRGWD